MTFFTVQFAIVNTIVLSVKEAVESMLKQNVRGTDILMPKQAKNFKQRTNEA